MSVKQEAEAIANARLIAAAPRLARENVIMREALRYIAAYHNKPPCIELADTQTYAAREALDKIK